MARLFNIPETTKGIMADMKKKNWIFLLKRINSFYYFLPFLP